MEGNSRDPNEKLCGYLPEGKMRVRINSVSGENRTQVQKDVSQLAQRYAPEQRKTIAYPCQGKDSQTISPQRESNNVKL